MSEDRGQCAAFQQISLSVLHLCNVSNSNRDNIRFTRSFITWDNMFINFVRQEELCKCLSTVVTIKVLRGSQKGIVTSMENQANHHGGNSVWKGIEGWVDFLHKAMTGRSLPV